MGVRGNSADDEALLEGETGVRLYCKKIEGGNGQLEAWGMQRLHARTHAGFLLRVWASLFALLCMNAC